MKLSEFFSKRSLLDEMQEQTEQKILVRGFWFLWGGLIVVMVVQLLAGAPAQQMAAEFILYMASCVYLTVAELRHGIWDKHFKPNAKASLALALAAGGTVAILNGAQGILRYHVPWPYALLTAAVSSVIAGVLTYAATQLCLRYYQKRRKALDTEESENANDAH